MNVAQCRDFLLTPRKHFPRTREFRWYLRVKMQLFLEIEITKTGRSVKKRVVYSENGTWQAWSGAYSRDKSNDRLWLTETLSFRRLDEMTKFRFCGFLSFSNSAILDARSSLLLLSSSSFFFFLSSCSNSGFMQTVNPLDPNPAKSAQ